MAGFVDYLRMSMGWWTNTAPVPELHAEECDVFTPGQQQAEILAVGMVGGAIFTPGLQSGSITVPGSEESAALAPGPVASQITY